MKKTLALTLAAVMALSLAACGGSSSSAPAATEAPATEAAATEAAATEAAETEAAEAGNDEAAEVTTINPGVLTMGTNAAFPPYEFYDADKIVGIDAEIAEAIAAKLGMTLEIVDMEFGSIITSVQTGKIDIGAAGMTVNEERLKNVDFTTSYSTGVQVVIVPEDSAIASIDDLEGALIGCQEGTTGYIYCSDDYGDENVVAYTNGATAVQALVQGKVDCVVIDKQPAINFIEANEGLKMLETEYVVEDYAIAVSKDNAALTAAINDALAELTADGTVQSILDKYIKAE